MNSKTTLRGPGSSRAVRPRRLKLLALGVSAALGVAGSVAAIMAGCGGNGMQPAAPVTPQVQPLSMLDVNSIVQTAVNSINVDMVVAVVDRSGRPLGVFRTANAPVMAQGNFGNMISANDVALGLARTGAFFSNQQTPLSSRTVRFISGVHFPPGIINQPNADLYGIENTNRGCQLVPGDVNGRVPTSVALGSPPGKGDGPGILTGKADMFDSDPNAVNPAGFPIFSQATATTPAVVVGGIGVVTTVTNNLNVAEFAAFTGSGAKFGDGSNTFGLKSLPSPGAVFIAGIVLPFAEQTTMPAGFSAGPVAGTASYVTMVNGMTFNFPQASTGQPPENDLIPPANGPIGGLTAQQVKTILDQATAEANLTRAAIRLPAGERTRMVIAVADLDGTIIGLRRMPDATIFSIDVAASKARNMTYFNSANRTANDMIGVPMGTAVTNRTISFSAQPFFPPGINKSDPGPPFLTPGPFFNLFMNDLANPCSQGFQGATLPTGQTVQKSGIVFFPGSTGIFVNGQLVGGLGVSGDGVDQDDFVTAGGIVGFAAPDAIRADQIFIRGVRLPYQKFPRNPTD
jgi:uncharacterized protein GlcG (DUF336 family)